MKKGLRFVQTKNEPYRKGINMDKKTKSFWMYTIILFTVALVLVLLGLFMTDYKEANQNYESRVQSMQNENLELKNENVKLKEEKAGLEVKNNQMSADLAKLRENENRYADAVENIYLASECYNEGKYQEAKEILDKVDPTILKEQILARYNHWKEYIEARL